MMRNNMISRNIPGPGRVVVLTLILVACLTSCAISYAQASASSPHALQLGDTTPPKVNITQPSNGSKVFGSIVVVANATDDTGVAYVEFRVDGSKRFNTTKVPYTWEWDTRDTPNGTHKLNATASDAAGNRNWSEVSVIIDNDWIPPVVSIVSPKDGDTIIADVTITANAADVRSAISKVVFSIDGKQRYTNTSATGPYKWLWNASQEKDGQHKVNVTALDKWNNNASKEITVNLKIKDVTPPYVMIDSPSTGSDVFGELPIYFTVKDNFAVKRVELFIDWKSVYVNASGANGSYNWLWATNSVSNSMHVINASAEDTSGNVAWDSILVNVTNLPPPQIISPQPEDTVFGNVLVQGTTSSLLITDVLIKIDGGNWTLTKGTSEWKIDWNTTKVANGPHNVSVKATDGKKYSATITFRVYVDNPTLECTITAPKEGDKISGVVNVTGTATKGTSWVEVSIDGSNWTKAKGNLAWYIYWDTGKSTNGKHSVNARAYNSIWQAYTPISSVGVNVSNEPQQNNLVVDPQVAGGIAALLGIFLVLFFLFSIARKKPEYKDDEGFGEERPEEEEKKTPEKRTDKKEKGPKKETKRKVKDIEKE